MTAFIDGPAKGQHLSLRRAPVFLRVVKEDLQSGKWDALDQLSDEPSAGEKLFAYVVSGEVGWCHLNRGRGGSGFYPIASYKFIEPQPSDAEMRTTAAWHSWCVKNDPRIKEAK
jgi:hypothetical protein